MSPCPRKPTNSTENLLICTGEDITDDAMLPGKVDAGGKRVQGVNQPIPTVRPACDQLSYHTIA